MSFCLGVDATNLRRGGGVTHLREFLRHADPVGAGFDRVIVWGDRCTLEQLEDRDWLFKESPRMVESWAWLRFFWQAFLLGMVVRRRNCHVLLVPGGSFFTNFSPTAVMCRNMLVFDSKEAARYGLSLFRVKLFLLRLVQSRSFRRASVVVFLTEYAKLSVLRMLGSKSVETAVTIPHGVGSQFFIAHREYKRELAKGEEFSLIYVSTVDKYKHQWILVEAVSRLRAAGYRLRLDLIGAGEGASIDKLNEILSRVDSTGEWATYHGAVSYSEIQRFYHRSDAGVFASSCENMPNILLEMMAAGLPVACSRLQPMPEILGDNAWYFDPEDVGDVAKALAEMLGDIGRHPEIGRANRLRASEFTWERCASDTLGVLKTLAISEYALESR